MVSAGFAGVSSRKVLSVLARMSCAEKWRTVLWTDFSFVRKRKPRARPPSTSNSTSTITTHQGNILGLIPPRAGRGQPVADADDAVAVCR